MNTIVISLGGSVIVPDTIDIDYLTDFRELIEEKVKEGDKRFIIVCGGGSTARIYQNAAVTLGITDEVDLDWIGIMSSRVNGELVRSSFGKEAYPYLIKNPFEDLKIEEKIIIAAGYQPGSSTDLRAVQFAKKYGSDCVINISNIDSLYSKDPSKYSDAFAINDISWKDFKILVGNSWSPGMKVPFDPIASQEAQQNGQKVIIVGKDIENIKKVVNGEDFVGTTIF